MLCWVQPDTTAELEPWTFGANLDTIFKLDTLWIKIVINFFTLLGLGFLKGNKCQCKILQIYSAILCDYRFLLEKFQKFESWKYVGIRQGNILSPKVKHYYCNIYVSIVKTFDTEEGHLLSRNICQHDLRTTFSYNNILYQYRCVNF